MKSSRTSRRCRLETSPAPPPRPQTLPGWTRSRTSRHRRPETSLASPPRPHALPDRTLPRCPHASPEDAPSPGPRLPSPHWPRGPRCTRGPRCPRRHLPHEFEIGAPALLDAAGFGRRLGFVAACHGLLATIGLRPGIRPARRFSRRVQLGQLLGGQQHRSCSRCSDRVALPRAGVVVHQAAENSRIEFTSSKATPLTSRLRRSDGQRLRCQQHRSCARRSDRDALPRVGVVVHQNVESFRIESTSSKVMPTTSPLRRPGGP